MGRASRFRSITLARGFRAAGTTCGLKPSGRPDLALLVSDMPSTVAGVTTRNKVAGAAVVVTRRNLRRSAVRAIVCNSGIANVATGEIGLANAITMTQLVARSIGCKASEVLPASTGLIGPQLPMVKIDRGIATAAAKLGRGEAADTETARAILTTDLVPKAARRRFAVGRRDSTLGAICKGSGMIGPDLATMLAFVVTDLAITTVALRRALRHAVTDTFNCTSVDGETSTSDMVLMLANGAAGNTPITDTGRRFTQFRHLLRDLCADLAYQLVKDGEGATKVFRVSVHGARSQTDADRIGRAVINSPLVKTAIHGGDPNWGRIICAAGHSGAAINPLRLDLFIGDVPVFAHGQPIDLDRRTAKRLMRLMGQSEIDIRLEMGLGQGARQWLGCDLSRQYVAINADYTT